MRNAIYRIIDVAQRETLPLMVMLAKVSEETGELSEATSVHAGYLPHKKMKEPLVGEVADVINTAIGVLVKAHPELNGGQIYDLLLESLNKKTDKWESVLQTRTQVV